MRRPQRRFGDVEKARLLKALGECRRACIDGGGEALYDRRDVLRGCGEVQGAIDDLAGILTGDRRYFWGKGHSSADYMTAKGQDEKHGGGEQGDLFSQ